MKKKIITLPIFYPNANFHIGTLHTTILGDIFSRLHKIIGYDVLFSVGLDEHGAKVAKSAEIEKENIMTYLDHKTELFKKLCSTFQINYSLFIRTTEQKHIDNVINIFEQLLAKGFIYEGIYSGYYSQRDETFFNESELVNGLAPTGAPVIYTEETCFFLKTSLFIDDYKNLLKTRSITFPHNRQEELEGFVSKELKDLCITRKRDVWGIKYKESTFYVWFDALINYLTICDNQFENVTHLIAKDILIFHGVYWPIILMAIGIPSFDKLFVHNYWLFHEEKMSKSLGNVVNPMELLNRFSVNMIRFYIFMESLVSNDHSFQEEEITHKYNTYLVNKFSNAIYRIWTLAEKNHIQPIKSIKHLDKLTKLIEEFNIKAISEYLFISCDEINERIEKEQLWKNKNPQIMGEIMGELLEIATYLSAVIPEIENWVKKPNASILFHRV